MSDCACTKKLQEQLKQLQILREKRIAETKLKLSCDGKVVRGSQIIATSALNKCLKNVRVLTGALAVALGQLLNNRSLTFMVFFAFPVKGNSCIYLLV